ncbi:MAG: O-methyltransferase [Acidobacteria bacterium]|nr:O-methyltransferase [Acidobacteriota bacterium]
MGQIVPDLVERYLASLNRQSDGVLDEIAHEGVREHLPLINAEVGALLRVLTAACGARRVLEVGTAIGYSTIWIAGALPPDGLLITMETSEERARRARANVERAGLSGRVSVMIGDAERLIAKVAGPFDLIFQDCDKKLYGPMLDRLVELLRPGGLLVTDNVLWDGEVVPGHVSLPRKDPADTRAIADYNVRLSAHPQLITSTIPLRDGLALCVKRGARELNPLLESLERSTRALRAADFNENASR